MQELTKWLKENNDTDLGKYFGSVSNKERERAVYKFCEKASKIDGTSKAKDGSMHVSLQDFTAAFKAIVTEGKF